MAHVFRRPPNLYYTSLAHPARRSIPTSGGTGGQALTYDPTDTAAATDAISFLLEKQVSDTALATDSPSEDFGKSITEVAATVTDTLLAGFARELSLSDTALGTDSVTTEWGIGLLLTDAATATDSSYADFSAVLAETATGTDVVYKDASFALSESTVVSDVFSYTVPQTGAHRRFLMMAR